MEESFYDDRKRARRGHPFEYRWAAFKELEKRPNALYELASKYAVAPKTLIGWQESFEREDEAAAYHGESTAKMRLAANEVICGLFTEDEALVRHGIADIGRLRHWIDRARMENQAIRISASVSNGYLSAMGKSGKVGADDETARLRQELEASQMRVVALETLIAVAERELGVRIVKKSGTKQSRK
jgi:hypothetical protein